MPAILGLNVNMKSSAMLIGEVAARFGLATHVLRHWESEGLLSPARVTGARRRYTTEDLYRVATILRAKEAGFPLPEIREMLAAGSQSARREVLVRQHEALRAKMARLRSAMTLLEGALSCTHEDLTTCPHFQSQLEELVSGARSRA
jgi:DNA-binding transcriptional MerR regulator